MIRTNISKVSTAIVLNYTEIHKLIKNLQSSDNKPAFSKIVEEVTKNEICDKKIRPSTPLMEIPDLRLMSPSDVTTDHMLLPTVSVYDS